MGTVDGLTKARMLTIEAASVISGLVNGAGHLILTKHDNSTLDAGYVVGPQGNQGIQGIQGNPGPTPTLSATSTTSKTIGTGSVTFALSPAMNAAFPVGAIVKATDASTPTNYMVGNVTASSTTSVTLNVTENGGSGTIANWNLTLGAFKGATGSQGIQGIQGIQGNQGIQGIQGVPGNDGLTPTGRGLSTTSLAIATGSQTFAISPAMPVAFAVGAIVKAVGATATNYMVGQVTAATTTSVTINVTETGGTGTFASWTLTLGAFKGVDGTVGTGPAGGDLGGNYPNPTIAALAVTDAKVAAANKDGTAATASMRTLGSGAAQAAPGNHHTSGSFTRYASAGQSVPSGAANGLAVVFDTNAYGTTLTGWTTQTLATAGDQFVCQVAGYYLVSGAVAWVAGSAANPVRRAAVFVNNTQLYRTELSAAGDQLEVCPLAPRLHFFSVGDVLDIRAVQISGAALSTSVGGLTFITVVRISS